MKIKLGYDHRGYKLANILKSITIYGMFDECEYNKYSNILYNKSLDYPLAAKSTLEFLLDSEKSAFQKAILICGSGCGMCIAANRLDYVRAYVFTNIKELKVAIQHNNINCLVLPANKFKYYPEFLIKKYLNKIITCYINTKFIDKDEDGNDSKYKKRLDLIPQVKIWN